jgi:hypothetical protein
MPSIVNWYIFLVVLASTSIEAVLSGTKSRPNEGNCALAHMTDIDSLHL